MHEWERMCDGHCKYSTHIHTHTHTNTHTYTYKHTHTDRHTDTLTHSSLAHVLGLNLFVKGLGMGVGINFETLQTCGVKGGEACVAT